jgi:CRISPR-associated endonuclease/helicase Cas3
MRFSSLPPVVRAVWAKSNETEGHGLLCHMLDVAAVARAVLRREPESTLKWAAAAWCMSPEDFLRAAPIWIGLHDIGKATPGFQAKWQPGKDRLAALGMPFHPQSSSRALHDLSSAGILAALEALGPRGFRRSVAGSVAGHHGYILQSKEFKAPEWNDGKEWDPVRSQILAAYLSALGGCPFPDSDDPEIAPPALAWLAGLTTACDWIGSNPTYFEHGEQGDTPVAHLAASMLSAERALNAIGWRDRGNDGLGAEVAWTHWSAAECVARALGLADGAASPRPLQTVGDSLLSQGNGPALVLVEAPMGEGKTELAFLAHVRLTARNQHRGLFVALPSQATSNAMFTRTEVFLQAASGPSGTDVQLIHGGAAYHRRITRLLSVNNSASESDEAGNWFSQRKRPLLAADGVGTVDQALLGALQVKHHFVRLWGLANRVVVVDEVHAYDDYTGGLVEGLLRWLKALGCSVVIMSATLPLRKRRALLAAWGHSSAPAVAYPRLLVADDSGLRASTFEARAMPAITVARLAPEVEAIAERAYSLVSTGGCGAVIVNTVARAQAVFTALQPLARESGFELTLFHARFPLDDRALREEAVIRRYGRDGSRPVASLLVATQVVEQSLDVDFDFLISDLAPIDLLLQRAGRLHRHVRTRPRSHAVPTLWVAGSLADTIPDLHETAWCFVYDPYVLMRSWECVRAHEVWTMPDSIDSLVQEVYGPDGDEPQRENWWQRQIDAALGRRYAEVQKQAQLAVNVSLDVSADGLGAFAGTRGNDDADGAQLRMVTRLGSDSLRVVPVHVAPNGWLVQLGGATFSSNAPVSDTVAQALYARQVSVSHRTLVAALRVLPASEAFRSHPLLRDLVPMPLLNGSGEYSGVDVRLDPDLGIVYARRNRHPEAK